MTQAEAKTQIIALWQEWLHANRSDKLSQDMMLFYSNVQKEHPQLLAFRAKGDKWQTFKAWIQDVH